MKYKVDDLLKWHVNGETDYGIVLEISKERYRVLWNTNSGLELIWGIESHTIHQLDNDHHASLVLRQGRDK